MQTTLLHAAYDYYTHNQPIHELFIICHDERTADALRGSPSVCSADKPLMSWPAATE